MNAVVHNLAQAPEADVQAIATYIASLAGRAGEDRIPPRSKSGLPPQGAAIYAGACAHCHDRGRRAQAESGLALEHSTAVAAPTPGNLIRVVRDGIVPAEGNAGPWMPAFGAALTDAQMVALTEYLRARYTDRPPWNDVEEEVRKVAAAGERE
jgi:mono/diheme cytochrome c family protein